MCTHIVAVNCHIFESISSVADVTIQVSFVDPYQYSTRYPARPVVNDCSRSEIVSSVNYRETLSYARGTSRSRRKLYSLQLPPVY